MCVGVSWRMSEVDLFVPEENKEDLWARSEVEDREN